jgi:hypothetical protein
MTFSSPDEHWKCPHCGFDHREQPFAVDGQYHCQGCHQWFASSGVESPPPETLELLDDHDLFKSLDLSGIDTELGDKSLMLAGEPVPTGQMASIRCRVCDTLQYVELTAGKAAKCEVCFAPFPMNPDGSFVNTKGKRGWVGPTVQSTVRDVSAEAVGGLARPEDRSHDEIDDLIHAVRADIRSDFEAGIRNAADHSLDEPAGLESDDSELKLQPAEESRGNARDHLYLGEEAKALLFSDRDTPEEVGSDALIPLDEFPPAEPLEAILDDAEPLEAILDDTEPLEAILEAAETPAKMAPAGPGTGPGTGKKTPPPFALPPVGAAPPAFESPRGKAPPGMTDSFQPQPSGGTNLVRTPSWELWKELALPFTNPWLIGVGIALLPLIYWAQLSWRLAIDDGSTFQKLVGYLSILFSSAIVLPLWLAFLGVIANRSTAVGQAGRLTGQAIFAQACQFAVVLACWIPGATLGTISMHYLVIGCLGAVTMVPGGLYMITAAVVSSEMITYYHPLVFRSLQEQAADWVLASVVVCMLLVTGILLAIATSYLETVGGAIFAMYIVPASMAYAGTIGCLAKRVLQLEEIEPQAGQW